MPETAEMERIMKNTLKRIGAIIGLSLIALWLIATVVTAFAPIPGKESIFPVMIAGCVIFPITLWIILWLVSVITKKKNIASFRSEEMEETMRQADVIRAEMSMKGNETDASSESSDTKEDEFH